MPEGVDEFSPDIHQPNLPLNLNQIITDLDSIHHLLSKAKSKLIVCSFAMIAEDSLLEQNMDYASVYSYWSHDYGNVPLSVIRRFNKFENLVFKKYALKNDLLFIDVANDLVKTPSAFIDGIHLSCDGMKLHAWSVFTQVLPMIEKKIALDQLPNKFIQKDSIHPYLGKDDLYAIIEIDK
jgi:hypothetical protein